MHSSPPTQLGRLNSSEIFARERRRHGDFFPPGIGRDVLLTNQPEFTFYPVTALYDKLLDPDRLRYTDKMLVTSAAYYKSRKTPGHELLLFTIADRANEPLKNYILLDRTPRPSTTDASVVSKSKPRIAQLLGGPARDQFCISYNGDGDSLLREFGGSSLDELEILMFPAETFYLYELIILAYVTSSDRPNYHLLRSQCYWFANTMWETMKNLVPVARVESHMSTQPQLLGLNVIREPSLVDDVINAFREMRSEFRSELERRRPVRRATSRYVSIAHNSRQSSYSEASHSSLQASQFTNSVNQAPHPQPARTNEGGVSHSPSPTRWWDLM